MTEYATVRTASGSWDSVVVSGPVVGTFTDEVGWWCATVVDERGREISGYVRDRWTMGECNDCGAWLEVSTLPAHVGSSWCPCS